MKKMISMLLACAMLVGMLAGCAPADKPADDTKPAGTEAVTKGDEPAEPAGEPEAITLSVWAPQEDQVDENSWLQVTCKKFEELHPEWKITWEFGVCSEGDAGNNIPGDPAAAGDVYMFANDQIGTLLQANAIAKLGGAVVDQIKADNSETMVASVTSGDGIYGVPFTGNTWYMYYDTSVFTEEDIKSLDAMLAKAKVAFPLTTGWYVGSFYVANGGTFFEDGTNGAAGIDFAGDKGVAVTDYLVDLVHNPNFVNDESGAGMSGLKDGSVKAIFSGTWDAQNAKEALGENYGAAQLPCITINGEQKQLRSFAGSKAIAVNPNADNMAAAVALAAYMGSAEAQLSHYQLRGIIPCAQSLMSDPAVAGDLAALAQDATIANTSILQPSIPEMGQYWAPAEAMAKAIFNGEVTHDNAAEKTDEFNASLNNSGL